MVVVKCSLDGLLSLSSRQIYPFLFVRPMTTGPSKKPTTRTPTEATSKGRDVIQEWATHRRIVVCWEQPRQVLYLRAVYPEAAKVAADDQANKSGVAGVATGMKSTPSHRGVIPTTRPNSIGMGSRRLGVVTTIAFSTVSGLFSTLRRDQSATRTHCS